MNMKTRTQKLCRAAVCTALVCVSAYINIPLPFTGVSLTAQTLAVNITALALEPLYALGEMIVYTLIGIAGVPVFAGGTAGIGKLAGPTGGYIIGFILAAFLISLAVRNKKGFKRYLLAAVCIGIPVIYLCGMSVMAFQLKKGVWALLVSTVIPFIPLDLVKCVAAAYICARLDKV